MTSYAGKFTVDSGYLSMTDFVDCFLQAVFANCGSSSGGNVCFLQRKIAKVHCTFAKFAKVIIPRSGSTLAALESNVTVKCYAPDVDRNSQTVRLP